MRALRTLGPVALMLVVACGAPKEPEKTPTIPMHPEGLQPGWNEIDPGGETECARGDPYAFFVAPGTTNKVAIDFMGGGACWTYESCNAGAGQLFDDSVDDLRQRVAEGYPGIYDRTRADSPFHDWWHVIVTYCSGDIHWGNNVATYTSESDPNLKVTIHHKGAVNAKATLQWVFDHFAKPDEVMVTGCSAGSYGSIYWAPWVKQHYKDSKVLQFGDSGAGVVTDSFFHDSFPAWNALANAPTWIPTLDPAKNDWTKLALPDLYKRLGAFYPDMMLGQYNTAFDDTQSFFYSAMGGDGADWSGKMFSSIAQIEETTPNFRSYIAPGNVHCVWPQDDFNTVTSNGVKFIDWFDQYRDGQAPQSVSCQGDECKPKN